MKTLTCKNHTDLRWTCKSIAWTGFYNGSRNIFFGGYFGADNHLLTPDGKDFARECTCDSSDLILAPESE